MEKLASIILALVASAASSSGDFASFCFIFWIDLLIIIMTEKKKDYDLEHMPKFIKEAPWYMSKDGKGKQEETILFH